MARIKNTFSAKLIRLLIFVIFMPMAILSTYISVRLYRTAIQNDSSLNQSNLQSISYNLTAYFRGFSYITDSLFGSEDIQELLLTTPETPYERLLADRSFSAIVKNIITNTYDVQNIYLIAADGTNYFHTGNPYLPEVLRLCDDYSDRAFHDSPTLTGFYTNSYLTGNTTVYIPVIMQPLFNLKTREYLGMAVVQFYSQTLSRLLDYNTDTTIIADTANTIVYHSDSQYIGLPLDTLLPDVSGDLVTYEGKTMQPTSITLDTGSCLIQLKDYHASSITFFMETLPVIWLFFICTLIFIIIAILMARRLTAPIRVLQNAMTAPWPDVLDNYVAIHTHDEFETLGSSYNHMLDQLKLYIEKSYNQEIQHLNAEFRALQSQINPHFLYNALESINSMARIQHMPEISQMICCLADMFRYTTQQTEKKIALRYEIQHVKNYYQLQNASCDDQVTLQYRIPDPLLNVLVPKLILQPVIENCFVHAYDPSGSKLHIVLSIERLDTEILIKIEDNGKGIPPEDLEKLQEKLNNPAGYDKPATSIGLTNINLRLKMLYQPGSGLEISSTPNKGTIVLLRLIEKEHSNV